MRRWLPVVFLAVILCFVGTVDGRAEARDPDQDDGTYVSHGEDDWDSGEEQGTRYSVGLGFGLVNLNEEALEDDVEKYFMASFRFPVGSKKGQYRNKNAGMRGFIEPEIGYWASDSENLDTSDLLLGANIIGVQSFNAVDFFVGGGIGLHFVDADVEIDGVRASDSNESLGVNAQFGADIFVAEKVSLFAVGRFDLVEDRDNLEAKAYVGVRFHF